jgi:hypothetical protein
VVNNCVMASEKLKEELHRYIDSSHDDLLLENFHQAFAYSAAQPLSDEQLSEVNESMAQYRSGNTKSHEEILQLLREWRTT